MFRYRRMYAILWRTFYAVIMVGCGLIIAYFAGRAGDSLFAAGVLVLTVAAVVVLFLRTFRQRHVRRVIEFQKPR